MVKAIQHLFEDMGVEVAEERVLQFIVQEIHSGKSVEEAMHEPYVENNTSPEWRRLVLERPEIIQAVEAEMEKTFGTSPGGNDSD
jgi:gamma-glutamyltranspeptidase